jgi:hypothetical protein
VIIGGNVPPARVLLPQAPASSVSATTAAAIDPRRNRLTTRSLGRLAAMRQ